MDFAQAKAYLLSKPEAIEDYPFGDEALVCKVRGKMFALLGVRHGIPQVNLKCDPEHAQALRDVFRAVQPGYHMNKRHWNTVLLDGSIPPGQLSLMMDHSYSLVVKGMTKRDRQWLELRYSHEQLYADDGLGPAS